MIYDSLDHINQYKGIHPNIDRAIKFVSETCLDVPEGRITIDTDTLFANVMRYEPKPLEEGFYEAHQNYVDIQIVLEGREMVYNAPLKEVVCTMPYDEARDIAFFEGPSKAQCVLEKGKFVMCMPTDAHMPGIACESGSVKKMVIKVKIEEGNKK